MAGNSSTALQTSAIVASVGAVLGLLAFLFEPSEVNIYGIEVSKLVAAFLIPVLGLLLSLFLALFVQCDPLIVSHTPESRAAVAGTIVLPSAVGLILHVMVLISGLARHELGTPSVVFIAGVLMIGIGYIFYGIEQNYVVGIRDIWTLRSPSVWERTHILAWKLYVVAGVALLILSFIVPEGFWDIFTIIVLFLLPTIVSVLYSYVIREDNYSYIVR